MGRMRCWRLRAVADGECYHVRQGLVPVHWGPWATLCSQVGANAVDELLLNELSVTRRDALEARSTAEHEGGTMCARPRLSCRTRAAPRVQSDAWRGVCACGLQSIVVCVAFNMLRETTTSDLSDETAFHVLST